MNTIPLRFTAFLAAFVSVPLGATAANWPGWRGPSGTGITPEKNLPLIWSAKENVRWRVDLPERGNSSPIIWNDRIFVTQAVGNRRTLICFDRADGKQLWQSGATYTEQEQTQRDNPYCSATPVTDGERVIASFGSAGLYCYDFAGKELWHREFGKMQHMFGNAASPIITGDLCVLNFGPGENARLVAVNKRTGEPAWEAQPPKVPLPAREGRGPGGPGGSERPRTPVIPAQAATSDVNGGKLLAPRLLADGDKDKDQKLSAEEFRDVAAAWFDKLDLAGRKTFDWETFAERIELVLPSARNRPPTRDNQSQNDGAGGPGWRPRSGPERNAARSLFGAADTNNDRTLTREEWTSTFAGWFAKWDAEKAGAIDETKLLAGLNAALAQAPVAGGGGPGGREGMRGRGGPGGGGGGASWSTPIIVTANGREELVVSLPGCLAAYDPKTGQQLWLGKGLGGTIYTSPVFGENTLFALTSGPGGGSAIAVKPGGSGDVTETNIVWKADRFKSGIGSGVIREGHLYTISQDGIAACTELQSGKSVWEERLKSSGGRGSSWSSMLLAGDRIYVPNQNGDVFVFRAAPQFELLSTNSVGESTNASLAAADGELYLRTDKALWCFKTAQ